MSRRASEHHRVAAVDLKQSERGNTLWRRAMHQVAGYRSLPMATRTPHNSLCGGGGGGGWVVVGSVCWRGGRRLAGFGTAPQQVGLKS